MRFRNFALHILFNFVHQCMMSDIKLCNDQQCKLKMFGYSLFLIIFQVTKCSPIAYFINMNKSYVEVEAHR